MVMAIRHELVAEHCADRVVANIIGHTDSSSKQLDSQMLLVTSVHQNSILLFSGKCDCNIGLGDQTKVKFKDHYTLIMTFLYLRLDI